MLDALESLWDHCLLETAQTDGVVMFNVVRVVRELTTDIPVAARQRYVDYTLAAAEVLLSCGAVASSVEIPHLLELAQRGDASGVAVAAAALIPHLAAVPQGGAGLLLRGVDAAKASDSRYLSRLLVASSGLDWRSGERESAESQAHAALDAATTPFDRVRARISLADMLRYRGQVDEAEAVYAEASREATLSGDANGQAIAEHARGLLRRAAGDLVGAEAIMRPTIQVFREAADLRRLARALGNLGVVMGAQGRLVEEMDLYRQTIDAGRAAGDLSHMAHFQRNLATTLLHLGQLDESEELLGEVVATDRRLGAVRDEGLSRIALSAIHLERGKPREAARELFEARRSLNDLANPRVLADLAVDLGRTCQSLGALDEADAHFERALALCEEMRWPALELRALALRMLLLVEAGRQEEARPLMGRLDGLCAEVEESSPLMLARLARHQLDGEDAAALIAAARVPDTLVRVALRRLRPS